MGVPGRIGDLQPFAELGRGAATIVYKAYQQSLNRVVLLKLLRPSYTHNEEIVRRFEEEARLIAQIQHPNVVAIYNYGRAEEGSFFVAEFVEGTDLASLLEDQGALSLELATYIVRECAKGLGAAHRANILHRDIKPRNILIGVDGQVKLTDFGMSSIIPDEEARGEVRGTPAYMAPEQLSQDTTTPASDLFSLGATFYEMLAGRKAFPGSEINESIDGVLNHDPLPSLQLTRVIPDDLRDILRVLLAKNPEQRPEDCQSVIASVNAFRAKYGLSAEASELAAYMEDPGGYEPGVVEKQTASESADASVDDGDGRTGVPALAHDATAAYRRLPRLQKTGLAVLAALLIAAAGYIISGQRDRTPFSSDYSRGRAVLLTDSVDYFDPLPTYSSSELFLLRKRASHANNTRNAEVEAGARAGGPETPGESADVGGRGYLTVRSTGSTAVFLNDDSLGRLPMDDSVEVDTGRHLLVLRHPDFPEHRDSVEIEPDEETTFDVMLESLVGQVDIRINPWAEVYVDGALRDTVPPASPFFLTPGRHLVSLEHPELGIRDTTLYIVAGERHQLEFNLQQPVK